jgi:hypothetical protein
LRVTRSRAYQKNDQTFVEQKNGAWDGVETARVRARFYAEARLSSSGRSS